EDAHLSARRQVTPQLGFDAPLEDREPVADRPMKRVAINRPLDERRPGGLGVDETHDPGRIAVTQERPAGRAQGKERLAPCALEESPNGVAPEGWVAWHV